MIGNDIVDLKLSASQSNWQRKGFFDKIFSEREQEYILSSNQSEKLFWRLWSMKEAAYKAHQRRFNLAPALNAIKFQCYLKTSEKGSVKNGIFEYAVVSETTSEYIYSEAFSPDIEFQKFSGLRIDISSRTLKNEVLKQISGNREPKFFECKIQKDKYGIPHLFSGKNKLETKVSLTHHGRFSAFLIASFY